MINNSRNLKLKIFQYIWIMEFIVCCETIRCKLKLLLGWQKILGWANSVKKRTNARFPGDYSQVGTSWSAILKRRIIGRRTWCLDSKKLYWRRPRRKRTRESEINFEKVFPYSIIIFNKVFIYIKFYIYIFGSSRDTLWFFFLLNLHLFS